MGHAWKADAGAHLHTHAHDHNTPSDVHRVLRLPWLWGEYDGHKGVAVVDLLGQVGGPDHEGVAQLGRALHDYHHLAVHFLRNDAPDEARTTGRTAQV